MNIGDAIMLTESVLVIDEIGPDFLITGTWGTVTGIKGDLLSFETAKGVLYDGIPIACAKIIKEGQAA